MDQTSHNTDLTDHQTHAGWSPEADAAAIYQSLRGFRDEKGWSLAALHAAIQSLSEHSPDTPTISLSYLGEIERGNRHPRLPVLLTIAKVLEIAPADLCRPSSTER